SYGIIASHKLDKRHNLWEGALLAKASAQTTRLQLTHRLRGQARSYGIIASHKLDKRHNLWEGALLAKASAQTTRL
ncbi:hypothetical protein ACIPL1_21645, partial [Pseudomonas sp. NPDC090202]|uniref:hypothetical protein n=1 Tax=Pseudomonas sp. NPDC090202 TaxID=3364476 RepID=UPI00382E85E4